MKVNSKNIASLTFSELLQDSLTSEMISVKVNEKEKKFKLKEVSLDEYQIIPEINKVKNDSKLILEFLKEIVSFNNSLLSTKELEGRLTKTQVMIDQEELEEKAENSKNYANLISIIITSILCFLAWTYSEPFAMFEFFNSLEMIYAVYFFDLGLNPVLSEFLVGMKVIKYIPTPFYLLRKFHLGQSTNEKLEKYGFERNLAILNLGFHLTLFFALIAGMALLSLVSQNLRSRFSRSLKFGFFLRFWIQANFEMMIAATFGMYFSEKDGSLETFDYCFCIGIICGHLFMCLIILMVLRKRSNLSRDGEINEFVSRYSTFFEDFKDLGVGNRLFYFLFICRRLILIIVIHLIKLSAFQLTVHLFMTLVVRFT
jgi:hypothetical protein